MCEKDLFPILSVLHFRLVRINATVKLEILWVVVLLAPIHLRINFYSAVQWYIL